MGDAGASWDIVCTTELATLDKRGTGGRDRIGGGVDVNTGGNEEGGEASPVSGRESARLCPGSEPKQGSE